MPYGGHRPGSGRPKKVVEKRPLHQIEDGVAEDLERLTPLKYMLRVMNDPMTEAERRDRMAIAAAPYMHERAGGDTKLGKKEIATQEAFEAGDGTDWGDDLAPATRLN
jgi:hypothetical protein